MKIKNYQQGSVLLTTFLSITVLTLICATSLYVTSQNAGTAMQTASWQQALTGAEGAVAQAFNALNMTASGSSGAWTNWNKNSTPMPTAAPSGGSATNAMPDSTHYNYLIPSAVTLQGEGNNSVTSWVMVDAPAALVDANGHQWYRIRATGVASTSGPKRVSNQKRDNDLRKINLFYDHRTQTAITTAQASRSIEVIAQPVLSSPGGFGPGFTMMGSIKLSGVERIDSFNSSNPFYSTNGLYDPAKYRSNAQISSQDSTGSNFNDANVYGNVTYSGPTLKGTSNVHGTVSTPYNGAINQVSDPTGTFTTINSPTGNLASGTANHPTQYKYNGDFTLNSGQSLTFQATNSGQNNNYAVLWVHGNINLNGQSNIVVQNGVNLVIYGDNDINFVGYSFNNQNNYSSYLTITGITPDGGPPSGSKTNKMTISDSVPPGTMRAVINAPAYYVNIKSSFDFSGAITGNSVQVSSPAHMHYDEALNTGGSTPAVVSNYAYASWFEDTR